MKFTIKRTSDYSGKKPPVRGAKKESFTRVDERTFKSPQEHDKRLPERPWLSEGVNHRKVKGGIARDFPNALKLWTIELSDFAAFLAFVKKHGPCIVEDQYFMIAEALPHIEIYDDYRE